MEIPDEMRVALASDYVRENFRSGEPWSMTIARAILAERRRCADTVMRMKSDTGQYIDRGAAQSAILNP